MEKAANKKQTFIIIFQWGILIAIGILFLINQCNKPKPLKQLTEEQVREVVQSEFKEQKIDSFILYTKQAVTANEATILRALSNSEQANKKEFDNLRETIAFHSERLKANGNQIDAVTKLMTETKIAAEAATTFEEDTEEPVFVSTYRDKYIKFTNTGKVGEDKSNFEITAINEFDIVTYSKEGKFYADILNKNPYTVTLPGTNTFKISDTDPGHQKKWGVSVYGGIGLSPSFNFDKIIRFTPQIGIGLSRQVYTFGK